MNILHTKPAIIELFTNTLKLWLAQQPLPNMSVPPDEQSGGSYLIVNFQKSGHFYKMITSLSLNSGLDTLMEQPG
eukprot:1143796-Ditylum_brightwellii.AAC.1